MPLIKTSMVCLYMDADAYIVIHENDRRSHFLLRRLFHQAGPQLREAYDNSGITLCGAPVITPGFQLKAKYVIHIMQTPEREKDASTLEQYRNALLLAQKYHCESVVFDMPLQYEEYKKANSGCREFAAETDMTIYQSRGAGGLTSLSLDALDRLRLFLDVDDEKADREEFERSAALIGPPNEGDDYEEDSFDDDRPLTVEEREELRKSIESLFGKEDSRMQKGEPEPKRSILQDIRPQGIGPQNSELQDNASLPQRRRQESPAPRAEEPKEAFQTLRDFLKKNDAGFKDTLLKYIDRTGKKDSEIYKKANVDRRLFSKILNVQGYNPSKPTAIAFAIALELNLEETQDLIGRAGYTLSQASTFDRIIEFFILEENYDIYEINEALFYFDQNLLGC